MESPPRKKFQLVYWSGRKSSARRHFCQLVVLVAAVGCQSERSLTAPPVSAAPNRTIIGQPANDRTMGRLSGIARHLSAALQEAAMRGLLNRALKSPGAIGIGIDLQDCEAPTLVGQLLRAGERRGGESAEALCHAFQHEKGLTLYVDRSTLKGWDSTTSPIVTALEDPDAPLPQTFLGYRSPSRTIEIGAGTKIKSPILVILPVMHPSRWRVQIRKRLPTEALVRRDPPPTQPGTTPPPTE